MDKIKYDQTEGFPLDVNILDFGQKANQISQQFGEIIAPLAIVHGCVERDNTIGDGLVYINGELLPFKGGFKQEKIRIVEEAEAREFENGNSKDVLITRYATFGAGAAISYNWSDFYRSMKIKDIERRLVHVGFIQDYHGSIDNIPAGWHLCDGTNNTPDLSGMFTVGYDPKDKDYDTIGKTGGIKEVTLTVNQMPKHWHTGSTANGGSHNHQMFADDISKTYDIDSFNNVVNKGRREKGSSFQFVMQTNTRGLQPTLGRTSDGGNHSHNFNTNETGGSQAHENRPPFYTLAKIIFLG